MLPTVTRWLIMQKVRGQAFPAACASGIALPPLVGTGFQILFHSPSRGSFHLSLTVLCAIGDMLVFSLGSWSTRIPTGFLEPRGTWDTSRAKIDFAYGALTLFGRPSQTLLLPILIPH